MCAVAVMMLTPPRQRYARRRAGAIARTLTAEQFRNRNASVEGQSRVLTLIRSYQAFKHAREFGFTLLNAYLAARVNSL